MILSIGLSFLCVFVFFLSESGTKLSPNKQRYSVWRKRQSQQSSSSNDCLQTGSMENETIPSPCPSDMAATTSDMMAAAAFPENPRRRTHFPVPTRETLQNVVLDWQSRTKTSPTHESIKTKDKDKVVPTPRVPANVCTNTKRQQQSLVLGQPSSSSSSSNRNQGTRPNVGLEINPNDNKNNDDDSKIRQQMESVQQGLRRAVNALVSVRAGSEATSYCYRKGFSPPPHHLNLRKDINSVQNVIVLVKEQIDELCTEWINRSKLTSIESTSSITTTTTESKTQQPHGIADGRKLSNAISTVHSAESQRLTERLSEDALNITIVEKENDTGEPSLTRTLEFEELHKEISDIRKERDALGEANKSLVFTVNKLMEEQTKQRSEIVKRQEQERQEQQQKEKGAYVKLRVADSTITIRTDEREKLSKAVETLTATLTSLLHERDRLSQELQRVTVQLQGTTQALDELKVDNEQLLAQLQRVQLQLHDATSDGRTIAAHGRVVSSSLLFTRLELTAARKRIQQLERTVRQLQVEEKETTTREANTTTTK